VKLYSKNKLTQKKADEMVEYLPSKCKAVSSNHSAIKKKKERKSSAASFPWAWFPSGHILGKGNFTRVSESLLVSFCTSYMVLNSTLETQLKQKIMQRARGPVKATRKFKCTKMCNYEHKLKKKLIK
jgi:hypothetical protein